MNFEVKQVKKRVFAFLLAMVVFVTSIPVDTTQVFAAIDTYTNFTFKVTEGTTGTPISGASVIIYDELDAPICDSAHITGEDGVAECEHFTAKGTGDSVVDVTYKYEVTMTGYETKSGEVSNTVDGWSGHIDVELIAVPQDVPDDAYTVTSYEGGYDGQPHSVKVELTEGSDYTIEYSVDGASYSDVNPEYTSVCDNTVYVRISKDGYVPKVVEGKVTITQAQRTDFSFADSNPGNLVYDENTGSYPVFQNVASSQTEAADLTVSYAITYESAAGIATVDAVTGDVQFTQPGTITVTATLPESTSGNYAESTVSYTIAADLLTRTDFTFANGDSDTITYGDNGNSYQNLAVDADGDGTISYEIVSQSRDGEEITEADLYAAEIDADGKLSILASGTVVVKATVSGGATHQDAEITYTLTIDKAEQPDFAFAEDAYNVDYGTESATYAVPDGVSESVTVYSISSGGDIGTINETTGEVAFVSQKQGPMTIVASNAGDIRYKEATDTCTVTINKIVLDVADPAIKPVVAVSKGENNWYTGSVEVQAQAGYQISKSDAFDAEWTDKVTFSEEGENVVEVYLKTSTGAISEVISLGSYQVDIKDPEALSITYAETVPGTIIDAIAGFFKNEVTVTLTAKDTGSGINRFVYKISDDEGEVTVSKENLTADENDNAIMSTTFTIPAQYKGQVSFRAYDEAGRDTEKVGEEIVIDNIEPGIKVSFGGDTAVNDKYYKAERIATITIKEANFDPADVVIEEGKKLDGETEYTIGSVTPAFAYNADLDVWEMTHSFTESGAYTFKVSYKDKSENVGIVNGEGTEYYSEFVIDEISPVINLSYADNAAEDVYYFTGNRTATFTITEHNFDAAEVDVEISAVDVNDKPVALSIDYVAYLKNPDNWSSNGAVHTATIELADEGRYTIDMKYSDKAGREQVDAILNTFCIDTTAPDDLKITYSENAVWEGLLNALTFGFYQEKVTVILEAQDDISKIARFDYVYSLSDDASGNAIGGSGSFDVSQMTFEGGNTTAKASFEIPAQFRGHVSFTAVNEATKGATISDEGQKEIVVDDDAPVVSVTYDNNSPVTGNYYKADRTATIKIREDNFFGTEAWGQSDLNDYVPGTTEEYLVISVGKRLANQEDFTVEKVKPIFTYDAVEDCYVATVTFDKTAEYTFDIKYTDRSGNVYDSYVMDEFVVDKTGPSLNIEYDNNDVVNGSYYDADRTAVITIEELLFDAANVVFSVEAVDANGDEINLVEKDYATLLQDVTKWSKEGDCYTISVPFDVDGNYTVEMSCTDMVGNQEQEVISETFCIDKVDPEVEQITYSTPVLKAVLETITFGFYKAPVTVTLRASDVTSGINSFVHSYGEEIDKVVMAPELTVSGSAAEYTFEIPAQFKGEVSFTAVDNAERKTTMVGDIVIVVDDKAPEVTVEYDNDSAVNDTYYATKRNAKISIDEDNFYATAEWNYADYKDGYLVIEVEKLLPSATEAVTETVTPEFTYNEESGCYEAELAFEEDADYTLTIAYTDRAGNAYAGFWDAFTVDTTAPKLEISYNNNNAENEIYYKENRTATIKVTEHNFNPEDIIFTVDAVDGNDSSVNLDAKAYSAYLRDSASWQQNDENKDEYTAEVTFDIEAMYTINMKYSDKAGNPQVKAITDTFCVDKTKPVLELTYEDTDTEVTNEVYYNSDRTAVIKVKDENFNAEDVVFTVKAVDLNNKTINLTGKGYVAYLQKDTSWTLESTSPNVYRAELAFDIEGMYTIGMEYTDKAGNQQEEVIADTFCIDKTAPTDCKFIIEKTDVTGKKYEDGIDDNDITFDKFYKTEVAVKINADCNVSGLEKIQYQKVNTISEYNVNGTWLDYDESTGVVVAPNEKFILFAKIIDKAGNVEMANSTGIIVDDMMPVDETLAPDINIAYDKPGKSGFYTEDIELKFSIVEPDTEEDTGEEVDYSGLNKVTCTISSSELGSSKSIELFKYEYSTKTGELIKDDGAVYDEDELASAWSGSCTLKASDFSCNDVVVTITAVDNAGNTNKTSTKAGDIKIDTDSPEITVEVSNSDVDSENVFKDSRTATIYIKERNFEERNVKLSITNTDGDVPGTSGWSSSGKGKDMVWTSTVTFDSDGDYEFDISYTDLSGKSNKGVTYEGVSPQKFTIDKTIPVIEVTYNNDSALNQNYYKESRTATVSVKEHNFDPERVIVTMNATDDGAGISAPAMSGWSSSGDTYTATISYDTDALYSFDIAVKDKAGNDAADFTEQTFYVDKTAPELKIDGIGKFTNNGTIAPVITFSDTNYDPSQVEILLVGANRGRVELDGSYTDIHNGRTFRFNNFAEEKEMDDIYTLTVNLTDKAGNTTTDTVKFSVNRFGSTYDLSEVADINGKYVKEAEDLVITEANVNELSNIKITLFKNNQTIVLKEGVDYRVDIEGSEETGYLYTYTIFKANFEEDGVYRLIIHSEDAAGNVAENTLDVKDKEISFGIDSTLPNINVTNLESDTTYVLENLQVIMLVSDNLLLNQITVYLDDYNTAYISWNTEEIAQVLSENGEFVFDVLGGSSSAHNVKIVCTDAAGNEQVVEYTDFYVTTDAWVRFVNNKPLFYGSIGGGVTLIGFFVMLVTRKKIVKK